MIVVFEGTQEEYWQKMADVVDQRIQANESKKVAPLSMVEACSQIGVSFPTMQKIKSEMGMTDIYPSDLNRILLKFPKYIKKSKVA